jgi:hypothetical protein
VTMSAIPRAMYLRFDPCMIVWKSFPEAIII